MKLKHVSFIELHFEKIFVGLAALVLIASFMVYGIGSPHDVEFDGQLRHPNEIDAQIASKAKSLKERALSDEPPEWADQQMVPYGKLFQERTTQPVLDPAMAGAFNVPLVGLNHYDLKPPVPIIEKPFYEPTLPDPKLYAWAARIGSLHPDELELNPEMESLFDKDAQDARAFDTGYISLVGKWDSLAALDELDHKPKDDENLRPVPEPNVKAFVILDVQVERQTPRPDGSWAAEEDDDFTRYAHIIKPNPVPYVSHPDYPGDVVAFDIDELLKSMKDNPENAKEWAALAARMLNSGGNQWQVIQPPFPQMLNEEWEEPLSPEIIQEQIAARGRQEEIEREIAEKQKKVDNLLSTIQRLQNRGRRPAAAPRPTRSGDPFGAGAAPAAPNASAANDSKIAKLQAQIDRIASDPEILKLQQEYQEVTGGKTIGIVTQGVGGPGGGFQGAFPGGGFAPPGPGGLPSPNNPNFRGQAGFVPPGGFPGGGAMDLRARGMARLGALGIQGGVLAQPEVTLYAHDFDVQPGKSYRYRLRVRMLNPLFNIKNMPPEQAEKHNDKFVITSKWTRWSDPMEVPRLTHFFVDGVSPSPPPGRVEVEVWKYYKGLWRTGIFKNIRPGSPIGQIARIPVIDAVRGERREDVDFFAGAMLLDIAEPALIRGVGGKRPEPRARILDITEQIVDRTASMDKESDLRLKLQQDKARLEGVAGVVPDTPLARVR